MRPGGSGLKAHLGWKVNDCGRKWEIEYWEGAKKRWGSLSKGCKLTLLGKWIHRNWDNDKGCGGCGVQIRMNS